MALKPCKDCGNQVAPSARTCPQCGARLPKKKGVVYWALAALMLWVLIDWIVVIYQESVDPPHLRLEHPSK